MDKASQIFAGTAVEHIPLTGRLAVGTPSPAPAGFSAANIQSKPDFPTIIPDSQTPVVVEPMHIELCSSLSLTFEPDIQIIRAATAEQRRRGKSMSRRSGQAGTIVKEGGWYRVRFRVDIPGQHKRKQMSIKLCPTSGPELLTKSERERRKVEIVNSFGANSEEHFNQVRAIETGNTFREQAKKWLHQRMTRKRKPVKPATIRGWESYLEKHLNPLIGDMTLPYVNNGTLKMLGEKLSDAGLSPTTIRDIAKVMRWVKASAVDDNGDEIYPMKWNYEFADIPVVENQHTPMSTGEEITKIIAMAENQERVIFTLFPASGLRAGELFGLLRLCSVILSPTAKKGSSFGLARGHHFSNRTSFAALCTRFSKNSESRNRASTDSAVSVSPTLNLATCPPLS
jgi:hypothetical protein